MTGQPTISINGTSHPILCGNVANIKEVAAMVSDYAKDEGQLILNRITADAAKKSKVMTFSGQTIHDKAHRFIVKFQL